jgi:hypothetical protein
MPKIFRTMLMQEGRPAVGTESHMLGVRVPPHEYADVSPDETGTLHSRQGGLSVARSVEDLLPHLVPKRLKRFIQGAGASDSRFVWSMGKGYFTEGGIADHLILRLKPIRADGKVQGLIGER